MPAVEDETFTIGIDVGGTFTDLFVWSSTGQVETFKMLTTPEDPSVGVLDGLKAIATSKGLPPHVLAGRVRTIVHGTTVTTNAVLTGRGAKCALITTDGVRDALEMRRGIREAPYDNRLQNVKPLVPRHLRATVKGRLDWQGKELEPIDLAGVRQAIAQLKKEQVEAIAICFLNSFANPSHERAAAELVRSELPDAFVSVSTEVLPTIRFYNRVSTTALGAFVGPVLRRYLQALTARLADGGFSGVLLIMQSSGGVGLPEVIARNPATTLLSGPAAGPHAGLACTTPLGKKSCLVVDMGGTSFDASLVKDGEVGLKREGEIDRLRIALPMLDIVTIGAGGGSIGWLDAGGLLRMGPQSAGARPGPACYGRGGELPACTDADLVLGYLDPDFFAGGRLKLDVARARSAIETKLAKPLGLSIEEAAAGMYRVINANMAHGVREITVKRGVDPREFPMVVAGGAGAIHACMIALELDLPTLVVPQVASTLCAAGMLLTDLQHEYARSCVGPLATIEPGRLDALVGEMVAEGERCLTREGVAPERREHRLCLDLRYLKQYHEVTVPAPRAAVAKGDYQAIASVFHKEHDRLFGYNLEAQGTGLELVNVRVSSIGRVDKPSLPRVERGDEDASSAKKGARRVYLPEQASFAQVPIFDGHRLKAGNRFFGPALVERVDTTIFVSESFEARVDDLGTCVLERRGGAR